MKDQEKYTNFALVREMMETPQILADFKLENSQAVADTIKVTRKLFLTGEGSSRIFPAKNAIAAELRAGNGLHIATDGSFQSCEYDLSDFAVFAASNSGQTKEIITLCNAVKKAGHKRLFGLTANKNTRLESVADQTFILSCGTEDAVAATKSVAEQALFYQTLLAQVHGKSISQKLSALADAYRAALTVDIAPAVTNRIARAGTIYFAGRNDGVAEELTLKTNEITRKKSDFLEGTYLLHGIEEVMNPDDVVILVDPYRSELELIQKLLAKGVGLDVFAIATEDTIFPTIKVNSVDELTPYVYLAAGWNILVEVGISLGINLDKPQRARKIGNVFTQ